MEKTKYITFRITDKLSSDYKAMCNKNGYSLSKRLRAFMEADIKLSKQNKNLLNEK